MMLFFPESYQSNFLSQMYFFPDLVGMLKGSFFWRPRRFWCDLALAVGVAAVVVDGGAILTNSLVVSYLLSVIYFTVQYYIEFNYKI